MLHSPLQLPTTLHSISKTSHPRLKMVLPAKKGPGAQHSKNTELLTSGFFLPKIHPELTNAKSNGETRQQLSRNGLWGRQGITEPSPTEDPSTLVLLLLDGSRNVGEAKAFLCWRMFCCSLGWKHRIASLWPWQTSLAVTGHRGDTAGTTSLTQIHPSLATSSSQVSATSSPPGSLSLGLENMAARSCLLSHSCLCFLVRKMKGYNKPRTAPSLGLSLSPPHLGE